MTNSEWPSHQVTGIGSIDQQHQELFDLVDAFCGTSGDRSDTAHVQAFLDRLIQITKEHFQCEERLMADSQYSRLGVHKVAHARLLAQITDIERRAGAGEDLNFDGFLDFLKLWLMEHVKLEDDLFVAYLREVQKVQLSTPPVR